MKKSRTRKLFPADEKLQNEIARRLKAGLPLAGLVAAALACGGCGDTHERSPHVVGKMMPVERQNVPEKRTPAPPPAKDNRGNNVCPDVVLAGVVAPAPPEPNAKQELPEHVVGKMPAPAESNAKREKEQPPRLLGAPLPPKKNP